MERCLLLFVVVEVLGIRSAVDERYDSFRLAFGEVSQFVSKRRLRIGAFGKSGWIRECRPWLRRRARSLRALRSRSKDL